jgi:hypothetical protein
MLVQLQILIREEDVHKSDCNNENSKAYNSKIYKTILERTEGGDNFKMVQLGTREQLTKRQAEQVEEDYRIEFNKNIMKIIDIKLMKDKLNIVKQIKIKLMKKH